MKCQSPFCIVKNEVRGRDFTPQGEAGLASIWCPQCISLSAQIQFFSTQTAKMVRDLYKVYAGTNLPKETKLFLEQFSREIIKNLGEEL